MDGNQTPALTHSALVVDGAKILVRQPTRRPPPYFAALGRQVSGSAENQSKGALEEKRMRPRFSQRGSRIFLSTNNM
jgi:hypothetical protein